MVSEEYYLVVNILFKKSEKKLIDENDKENPIEIDITSLEGKKIIFKREVEEWLLKPMEKLLLEDAEEFLGDYKYKPFRNSIFVLFGLFAYIEKMELYRGNGTPKDRQSTQRLLDGMKRIFSNLSARKDEEIKDILIRSRHNLMHQAMIGDEILLNMGIDGKGKFDEEIGFDKAVDIITDNGKQEIRINPIKMYDEIQKDFKFYLSSIYTDTKIQKDFQVFFDDVYKYEIDCLST